MGRAFEFRKARKMKRWSTMAKVFTRIGRDIAMAVKEKGSHLENNSKLRSVVQNAKAANMPKENIERAIKNALDKNTKNYKKALFEGYAPHGIAILVETASNNNNRTVANVRYTFNKNDGAMAISGSVAFIFDHVCNFRINMEEDTLNSVRLEHLELELIDFEVEEIFQDEDGVLIYAPFSQFGTIQQYLEMKGLEILSSDFEYIPRNTIQLTGEKKKKVETLLEKLEELDDVQSVYHNMN